jgi:uncharacterized protein YyaL (SSP411 family)
MHQHKPNRLAQESSPYLLQHAHNPVDWHPWGAAAFELARKENKPIFLSVGYSTCYWCHVMERQSFENEAIAAEMNRLFVNIKVDREERPDVDQIYMTAVQVMTHRGGWPMSVWLTPELKPFYAGTYFPPEDSHGRAGFLTLCRGIADAWENRNKEVRDAAEEMTDVLRQLAKPQAAKTAFVIDDAWVEQMIRRSTADYDPENGGFGSAPKFPRETLLRLLLVHQRTFPNPERMKMILHTLDALAAGGIRDHLGGGFHRYSTDAHWLVPHFEIMLYDNAMLAWIYAEAFAQTGKPTYEQVARGILDFLLREMKSPDGAFYTAFDAEVDGMEGANYLWTLDEIRDILGDADAEVFARAYGLNQGPNFVDPHHGGAQPEKNVLFRAEDSDSIAKSLNVESTEIETRLAAMREKLYAVRQKRKQPSLDNKILISWNALAMSAFAHAGRIFKDKKYFVTAHRLAIFFLMYLAGKTKLFLDDDAFLADAFLELADAEREDPDRRQASYIIAGMHKRFADSAGGAYFFTSSENPDLIIRQKIGSDTPLPAGAAVVARVLLQLGDSAAAQSTLTEFAGQLQNGSESMSAMLELAHLYLRTHPPLEIDAANIAPLPHTPRQLAEHVLIAGAVWQAPDHLILRASIFGGYHINSHNPPAGLSRTHIEIRGGEVDRIDFPPTQPMNITGETIDMYTGKIEFHIHFRTPPNAKNVELILHYQPCDESACLMPVSKTIPISNSDKSPDPV